MSNKNKIEIFVLLLLSIASAILLLNNANHACSNSSHSKILHLHHPFNSCKSWLDLLHNASLSITTTPHLHDCSFDTQSEAEYVETKPKYCESYGDFGHGIIPNVIQLVSPRNNANSVRTATSPYRIRSNVSATNRGNFKNVFHEKLQKTGNVLKSLTFMVLLFIFSTICSKSKYKNIILLWLLSIAGMNAASTSHLIVAGASFWSASLPDECTLDSATTSIEWVFSQYIGVRCCSLDGSLGLSEISGTCYQQKTFDAATAICENAGFRLCTKIELYAVADGTGCDHDSRHVWVSDECQSIPVGLFLQVLLHRIG